MYKTGDKTRFSGESGHSVQFKCQKEDCSTVSDPEIKSVISVIDTLVRNPICRKNTNKCVKIERVGVGVQSSAAEIAHFLHGGQTTLNTKVDRDIHTDTIEKYDKTGKIVTIRDKIVIIGLEYLKSENCCVCKKRYDTKTNRYQ